MKIRNQLFLTGCAAAMLLWSCAKDTPENTWPNNTSTGIELQNFLDQYGPPVQTFTFNAAQGTVFYGAAGTVIQVSPNAFLYPNNQPVAGTVTMNLREIYSKKDAFLAGGFTTSNDLILHSDGEIYIDAWQGSSELHLASNSVVNVTMPSATNGSAPMYEFYAQDLNGNQDFVQASPAVPITAVSDSFGNVMNSFDLDGLHWVNCDYFGAYTGTRVDVKATPAPIWNFNDCDVCLSINGTFALIGMYYDQDEGCFVAKNIPEGLAVTLVCVAVNNRNFYYQEIDLVTEAEQSVSLTPTLSSEAAINQHLLALN